MDIDARNISKYQKMYLNEGALNQTVTIEMGVFRQTIKQYGAWERVKASEDWKDAGMAKERKAAGLALTISE